MKTKDLTPHEAKLNIHKHLTEIMVAVVFGDEKEAITADDKRDAEDLSTMIISALGLRVMSTSPDGTFNCSINLLSNIDSLKQVKA